MTEATQGMGSNFIPVPMDTLFFAVLAVDIDTTLPKTIHVCYQNYEPVSSWCRTWRPSRTGFVLVGTRFSETTDDIFYSILTAMNIDSYPTPRKAIFTQCDDLGPFFGKQIRTCTHDKLIVYTETDFEGTSVFVGSRQATQML